MPCPHCGPHPGSPAPPCPQCSDYALPAPQATAKPDADIPVVEPEILNPHEPHDVPPRGEQVFFRTFSSSGGGGGQHGFGQFRFATWSGNTPLGGGSCLPGAITLVLVLACGVQFGFLAALGFVFFYLIGSAAASAISLQRLMQGKPLSPFFQWAPRVVVWAGAWLLTAWLAGGA